MIISLIDYVQDHHQQIIKKLKYHVVPDIMVTRLEKRLKHCKKIMEHYARLDSHTYTFNINDESHEFGNPFIDFMSHWNGSHMYHPNTAMWEFCDS